MSLVIIFKRNSGSLPSLPWRSRHVLTQFSFCSSLSWKGTNLEAIRRMFTQSFKMLWTDPDEILNVSATLRIVILLFSWTSSSSWSTSSSFAYQCSSEHLPSSTEVTYFWTLKTVQRLDLFPLSVLQNTWHLKVSVSFFPSLKQNLMQTCYLSSLSFSGYKIIANGTTNTCT